METYAKVSVGKPGENKGAGSNMRNQIVLFDFADVLQFPDRDSNGVVISGNIIMKPGTYMIELYQTPDKYKVGSKGEGETDAKGIKQSFEMSHPGDEIEIKEFRFNWLNKSIGVIVTNCSNGRKQLLGSECAPMSMVFDANWDKESNFSKFTFASVCKGPDIADYQGTITLDSVTGTVAANAISVNLANGAGQYQLTSGTAAAATLTGCTNAVNGLVFTLKGSGGTYPSVITSANDFILLNGTTWTGLAGAEITFKAFKDGASSYKYLELSRS